MSDWPKRVEMHGPSGTLKIEAHAPWCPQELARATIAGGQNAVVFQGLTIECTCASPAERAKHEALTAMVPW